MNRTILAGTTITTCGWLYLTDQPPHVTVIVVGIGILAGAILAWRHFGRSAARVVRTTSRARRKHGMASTLDIVRFASAFTVRRKAPVVRPSLRALGFFGRWLRLPTRAAGVRLCKVGPLSVWVPAEIATVIYGGPRQGKTGLLGGAIIDAPGAVVSTSTRRDLYDLTGPHRASGGRPVYVYNPAGLGGLESSLGFNPLDGCEDPRRATETATDMIPAATGDGERWDQQARRVLAVMLHAAALNGLSIQLVAEWVADPDGYAPGILSALRRSPDQAAHVTVAKQFIDTNARTRSSITSSIMPALAWLTSPEAVKAISGGTPLDVAELIRSRATVYLLGRHEAHTAGLLAALTGRIVRDARALAGHLPGGRLDPPLTLALDEAARIAPVPLPDISGDCGGTGITLLAVFQSRADVSDRWGTSGAARLITNCGARVLFGGCADADELKAWSDLAGTREEKAHNHDKAGSKTGSGSRLVPVLSTTQIANPGEGRVVVFHSTMLPVIGKARMVWHRHDVRNTWRWRLLGAPIARWRAAVSPTAAHLPPSWAPTPPTTPSAAPTSPSRGRPVGDTAPSDR